MSLDHAPRDENALMTSREVARRLNISECSLRKMRSRGIGPSHFLLGGRIRYHPAAIDAWLERHIVQHRNEVVK
jgi:excisionase family DNA binding protein